jgi:hypothetical protein
MADSEQAQPAASQPLGDYKMHLGHSQRLIALGFDPNAPVYSASRGWSEEAITQAVFGGERGNRKTVDFRVEMRDEDCVLPMEIDLIQVVFVTEPDSDTGQLIHYPDQAWYMRGYLGRCDVNPDGEVVRMHAYTHELGDGEPSVDLQIVREIPVKIPALSLDGCLTEDARGRPVISTTVGY